MLRVYFWDEEKGFWVYCPCIKLSSSEVPCLLAQCSRLNKKLTQLDQGHMLKNVSTGLINLSLDVSWNTMHQVLSSVS